MPPHRRMGCPRAESRHVAGVIRSISPARVPDPIRVDPVDTAGEMLEPRELVAEGFRLSHVLTPRSVAVIGASRDPGSIGHRLLLNVLGGGFAGPVFAVNPRADAVAEVPAYASVGDIPEEVDLAIVAVPAAAVPAVVDACGEKGVRGVVVVSAGFSEIGPEGAALEREVLRRVRRWGMRLVGPNCLGVLNTAVGLNATFAPARPSPGRVAFLSQSGALGIALIDWTGRLGIGLSSFVSIGNAADVSGNDLLQFWEDDPQTAVILLYLESFGDPRTFSRLARRVGKKKPVVAVKSGRTSAGTRAASSHTASAASADVAVDALFLQAGVTRVETLEQLFDVARVLATQPLPSGRRVAILGNSGGPGILAADACDGAGLLVPALAGATQAELRALLGPHAAVANPVDMVAAAGPGQYEQALRLVLADDNVDAALAIYTRILAPADDVVEAIERAAGDSGKPVVATVFAAGAAVDGQRSTVPRFTAPEPAAMALGRIARYAEWLARDRGVVPDLADVDRDAARALVDDALRGSGDGWLAIDRAAELLRAYGVRVVAMRRADDAGAAVALAEELGYPVALKAASGAIVHKTDVGALRLDLRSGQQVRDAYAAMQASLGDQLGGVVVQRMARPGIEVIVGVVQDPSFGPLLMFGMGGVATELFADRTFRILPLTDVDARDVVRSLRASPLFFGYRGEPPADAASLEDLLLRVARLAGDVPEVSELDLNPVLVSEHGTAVVDVKVRLRSA